MADFLDRPSADGFHAMTAGVQAFVQFETDEVLTEEALAGLGVERTDGLAAGHAELAARLNLLRWAVPGTAEAQNAAHMLRHELLAQTERYQALRLPRGALINGA